MKTTIHAGIVTVMCFAFSCSRPPEHLTLGVPRSFENLTLYPVHANGTFLDNRGKMGNYLTLNEAVEAGKVTVTEMEEGEVNTLWIENTSADTVMILNGETVVGGRQNRMIAMDVLLAPHSGKLDVSVFCVEKGRWNGDSEFMVTEQSLPPGQVRSKVVMKEANQGEVWEDIKVSLDMVVDHSPTSALHDIKLSAHYRDNEIKYLEHFSGTFAQEPDIVGVVAVTSDGAFACDIFATPALFKKHYANLLQSYAGQAMVAEAGGSKPDVDNFWRRAMRKMKQEGFMGGAASKKEAHFAFAIDP